MVAPKSGEVGVFLWDAELGYRHLVNLATSNHSKSQIFISKELLTLKLHYGRC